MVELYIRLITSGLKPLGDVPEKYRDAVAARIGIAESVEE